MGDIDREYSPISNQLYDVYLAVRGTINLMGHRYYNDNQPLSRAETLAWRRAEKVEDALHHLEAEWTPRMAELMEGYKGGDGE